MGRNSERSYRAWARNGLAFSVGKKLSRKRGVFIGNCWAERLPGRSAIFVIHRDLQGAQEAVILGGEFDLAGRFKTALRLLGHLKFLFLVFAALFATVKTNGGFQ